MPERDDALYLAATLVRMDGTSMLTPAFVLPMLQRLGRRVEREGVILPSATTVALDRVSGVVTPHQLGVSIPLDAKERLAAAVPLAMVDAGARARAPVRIGKVLTVSSATGAMPEPISRAMTLHAVATWSVNLNRVPRGLVALGSLVARAECYAMRWKGSSGTLRSIVDLMIRGDDPYAIRGTEDTPPDG